MLTVRDLLRMKGDGGIWAVTPDTTTLETIRTMAEKNVGALVVIEDGVMMGIISERDFVYRIAQENGVNLQTPIREYMTTRVITVRPETGIDECMKTMTNRRIRHLPVTHDDALVGLISIGDVVKGIISEQESTIDNLQNYITGTGYGR